MTKSILIVLVFITILVPRVAGACSKKDGAFCYVCINNLCQYNPIDPIEQLLDFDSCIQTCGNHTVKSSMMVDPVDNNNNNNNNINNNGPDQRAIWTTLTLGACHDCSVKITLLYNFSLAFEALGANRDWNSCKQWSSSLLIPLPVGWQVSTSRTLSCDFQTLEGSDITLPCSFNNASITFSFDSQMMLILGTQTPPYNIQIVGISSPRSPMKSAIPPAQFIYNNEIGCISPVRQKLLLSMPYPFDAETSAGTFNQITTHSTNSEIGQNTTLTIGMNNGAKLEANSTLLLSYSEETYVLDFLEMFRQVDHVDLVSPIPYPLALKTANGFVRITIPETFPIFIENGEPMIIRISNVINPSSTFHLGASVYTSALASDGLITSLASSFRLNPLTPLHYKNAINPLNVISAVLFGISMIISLGIIRWHGLPFTPYSIWTDLVAVFAVTCFSIELIAYIVWMVAPSQAFFYFYSLSYCCTASMIISLCFHWGSVLSGKLMKRITFRSPILIAYITVNLVVFSIIAACIGIFYSKLGCVYRENALACQSVDQCSVKPAADGIVIRGAVRRCNMGAYYITLTVLFMVYSLLLMILGCMVMNRGRMVMLTEDVSQGLHIRHSLTIFYAIIASTCIIYITAQLNYILQAINYDQQDELVWYIFVVWLPQCLPPLLLLFLQWNPSHAAELENEKDDRKSEDFKNDGVITPDSCSSTPQVSRTLNFSRLSDVTSLDKHGNSIEDGSKIGFCVRLKIPAIAFQSSCCFISLEYCATKESVRTWQNSSSEWLRSQSWCCVGMTERVDSESLKRNREYLTIPFVAVLEIPILGPMSNTLLRFMLHCSKIRTQSNETTTTTTGKYLQDPGNSIPIFKPICEFVTCAQTVLDAAMNQQPLHVSCLKGDNSAAVLADTPRYSTVDPADNAELYVQTVMHAHDNGKLAATSDNRLKNIVRFFQYDSIENGGLVVEDLQESKYSNVIPRQLLEIIAIQRQDQLAQARWDSSLFNSQKKTKQNRGFYGNLIGQIQNEGDLLATKKWLEERVNKRKEYIAVLRKAMQTCMNRDKNKEYFKSSIEKKSKDLRFLPLNIHMQDLYVGPMTAFTSVEKRKTSKEVSTYEITTSGAMAAHVYNFKSGGILSLQSRAQKIRDNLVSAQSIDQGDWSEDLREFDDLLWDIQLRMDVCLTQAVTALVTSFCRKVEIALQNPDVHKGEDILRKFSTLGFLLQVESLLSTHGKEIGMLEDMSAAVEQLACVSFVLEDINEKPMGRFSFRNVRKKGREESSIAKVYLTQINDGPLSSTTSQNNAKGTLDTPQILITLQVYCGDVALPERLAAGGKIAVIPVLFTQGINEMQTIANNTERSKTELQDTININNLRPLKAYCDKYCRLAVALPPSAYSLNEEGQQHRRNYARSQYPLHLSNDQVLLAYTQLEMTIYDAAQSTIKTKHPEILTKASDLCRELGGGRVTICKSAKDRTAMSVTLEQGRILHSHHSLPLEKIPATVAVMRTHGVRIENALKNTGKRFFAFNKLQRSLLPEEYRCPDSAAGAGNVS